MMFKQIIRPTLIRRAATQALGAVALAGASFSGFANTPAPSDLGQVEPRIVGGSEVTSDDRPWMAAILSNGVADAFNAQFCGGSVISPTWVLTAAHCLDGEQASRVDVMVGRRNLRGSGGERVRAKRIVMHPRYNASQDLNDIALIELREAVSVAPVSIATPGNSAEAPGRLAEVMGWGNLRESGGSSPRLMGVRVPVVSQAVCNRQYGGINEDAMICAGFSDGGRDSCQGDSGGPLFVPNDGGFSQIGVVSFGQGCARANFAGVYARVSNYFDWIRNTAGIGGGEPPPPPPSGDLLEADFRVVCRANRVCRFNASPTQSDSRITSYVWDTGDGREGTGRILRHRYVQEGRYPVSLFVTNADGELDEVTKEVVVGSGGNGGDNEGNDRQFSGDLDEKSRVILPGAGSSALKVKSGELKASLRVASDAVFVMQLRRYDSAASRWVEVARVRSRAGGAEIARNVRAGRYSIRLIARRLGGDYQLEVSHQ